MGNNMIISQFSIAAIGVGTSIGKYIKIAIDTLKKSNVKFKTNDMTTVIETKDLVELFKVVSEVHNAVLKSGVKRVIIELKIDDRRDKNVTLGTKLEGLELFK
jgi:uncharacterized protein (TIGR00106 family)